MGWDMSMLLANFSTTIICLPTYFNLSPEVVKDLMLRVVKHLTSKLLVMFYTSLHADCISC